MGAAWDGVCRRQGGNVKVDSGPWHISRTVTLGTIIGLLVLLGSQIYQYGALNEKISSLEKSLDEMKDGHVPRETVEQMLIVRDVQIDELKEDVKQNQDLLREILTKLPNGD